MPQARDKHLCNNNNNNNRNNHPTAHLPPLSSSPTLLFFRCCNVKGMDQVTETPAKIGDGKRNSNAGIEWKRVRLELLPELTECLTSHMQSLWVPTKVLFNDRTLPLGTKERSFSGAVWTAPHQEISGTHVYVHNDGRHVLLRHRFASKWFLLGKQFPAAAEDLVFRESFKQYLNEIVRVGPSRQAEPPTGAVDIARRQLTEFMKDLCIPEPQKPPVVTPGSATARLVRQLGDQPNPLQAFLSLDQSEQQLAFKSLMARSNAPSGSSNERTKNAQTLLEMFRNDFQRQKFVENMLNSEEARTKGNLLLRAKSLESLSKNAQANVTSVMADLAINIAKILLPANDAPALLNLMTNNKRFRNFAMPDCKTTEQGFEEFKRNPVVLQIKSAIKTLGLKNQQLREQLVSLLNDYPKLWIESYLDVGRKTITSANDHAAAFGAGLTAPAGACKVIKRNCRGGPKEFYLQDWMKKKENTESSPEIKRNKNGQLLKQNISYRILNRAKGYEKYKRDADAEGFPAYGITHFYKRNEEMGLKDSKSEAGLCPNCNKYGAETWSELKASLKYLYPQTDSRRRAAEDSIDRFRQYFVRGGPFYHSLDQCSTCIDWCCRYALSDPFDEDFQSLCDDHQHTSRDKTLVECDKFFDGLIKDSYVKVASKLPSMQVKTTRGEEKQGTAVHLRGGLVRIKTVGGPVVDIRWDHTDLSYSDLNLLCLTDYIIKCRDKHLRYRKHLYLDRNQSYGEIQIGRLFRFLLKMDYMMKLRSKEYKSDTSLFHLLMSKGCSVHVACIKERIDEILANQLSEQGSEGVVGDYSLTWVDSFGSNTAQGSYETLCVMEATMHLLKTLNPRIIGQEVALCSDAGSGYKGVQTILGYRAFMERFGIRVRHVHFNASGEGKRWETDGHNTDIKVRREQAMRAGDPSRCATPATEVKAQKFSGGITGSFPVLFEVDYEYEAKTDTWDGIQSFHDFILHDNGDITAFKSYGIGPGKIFKKDELDKIYTSTSTPLDKNEFPQKATGASFVEHGKSETEFEPKTELSSTRKRQSRQATADRVGMRKKAKADTEEAARELLEDVIRDRAPFQCSVCERRFATERNMEMHSCHSLHTDEDNEGEADASVYSSVSSRKSNREATFSKDIEEFQTPATCNIEKKELLMGHGLITHRSITVLDDASKSVLDKEFQCGVDRASNRKGVLEMVEKCETKMPELLRPSVHEVISWYTSRLKKEKEKSKTKASSARKKSEPKSDRHKRQEVAASLKMVERTKTKDPNKKHLFVAKYIDIYLSKDDVARVVTAVEYSTGRKTWFIEATRAKRNQYDDRVYIPDDATPDTICIDITNRSGGPSKLIKDFNRGYLITS
jgi:hypothetical protein